VGDAPKNVLLDLQHLVNTLGQGLSM